MTTFDWAIVALVLLLGLRGLGAGFLVGALSFGGTLAGLYLGSRVASSLLVEGLPHGGGSLIFLFVVLMSALLGEAIVQPVGQRLRARVPGTFLEPLDRLGGAILGAAAGLLLAWAVGAVGQQAPLPPALQASVQRSEILGQLDERLPSRTLLQAFSRFDPLPRIEGPRPEVPAPDAALLDDPAVQRAAPSVVRVTGIGDGFGSAGSGWVAAPNLVVTNAHVVAGTECTAVQPGGVGEQLPAEFVLFDEGNDLAVLRTEGLDLPALPLAAPEPGEAVAILGYPQNGPFSARAGRVGGTQRVLSSDVFGRGPVERVVTSIRGLVMRGNSGGPVVNSGDEVVATVFAGRVGTEGVGYGVPSSVVEETVGEARERGAPAAARPFDGGGPPRVHTRVTPWPERRWRAVLRIAGRPPRSGLAYGVAPRGALAEGPLTGGPASSGSKMAAKTLSRPNTTWATSSPFLYNPMGRSSRRTANGTSMPTSR